jgi:hypothetical protein
VIPHLLSVARKPLDFWLPEEPPSQGTRPMGDEPTAYTTIRGVVRSFFVSFYACMQVRRDGKHVAQLGSALSFGEARVQIPMMVSTAGKKLSRAPSGPRPREQVLHEWGIGGRWGDFGGLPHTLE